MPRYRTGGFGKDGTCDCAGLIMGAAMRCGEKRWPLHSTNWLARQGMAVLFPLESEHRLQPGMVLLKSRPCGSSGWDLHPRYQSGGRCFTGDLTDYYHAGVVAAVSPLCILHCTSGGGADGIVRDETAAGWDRAGWLRGLEPSPGKEVDPMENYILGCEIGETVNLRRRPDKTAPLLGRLRAGSSVALLEQAEGWAKVRTSSGVTGYVMSSFLHPAEHGEHVGNDAFLETLQEMEQHLEEISLRLDRLADEVALYLYKQEE